MSRLLVRSCLALLLLSCAACEPDPTLVGTPLLSRPLGDYKNGVITYYDADGRGNCSFDASPRNLDVAAIIKSEYEGSALCGACAEVEGPQGSLVVRIVDSCPDCTTAGHLDLSREAFAKLADPVAGRVSVRWRLVSCPVTGPVQFRFKEGSSEYWTALQVRNHHLPIQKLEWWSNNQWVTVPRADYNYFVASNGMGKGALKLRLTSRDGQVLEETLSGIQDAKVLNGIVQFPQLP